MLFHFLSSYINIFRYLTFRAMGAAVTSFLLIFLFAPFFIEKLRIMRFGQQVRENGPATHLVKNGTPTMGGIFMWTAMISSTLIWASWNSFVLIACLSVLLFASIGFIDDYAKIQQKNTKGLSPRMKLFYQSAASFVLLLLVYLTPSYHAKSQIMLLELTDSQGEILQTRSVDISSPWSWTVSIPPSEEQQSYSLISRMYDPETGKINVKKIFNISALITGCSDIQEFSSVVLEHDGYTIKNKITRTEQDQQGNSMRKDTEILLSKYQARLFNAQFLPYYSEVVWYWPLILSFLFYMFIIIGVSNSTNLSDGLDGLAAGMGISFYVPFGVFAYLIGHSVLSSYLFLPYIPGIGELSIVIAATIGAFSGFLWYNVHPAEIFMGDTGSLPMGAVVAIVAIMLKQELLLIIAGFMFVLETLSVIIQVAFYKKYKKRVFRMAPIHHHFELSGWKENQVVVRFWMMGALCSILALASIKIR